MKTSLITTTLLLCAVALAACAKESEIPSKYPARQPGCEVRIFPNNPSYPTDNIGPVSSTCDESVADQDCLRTMQDEACKLGADTVWGVSDKPELKANKKHFYGRAAHQK